MFFFLLTVQSPPISTLFPYTTLFRSAQPVVAQPRGRAVGGGSHHAAARRASDDLNGEMVDRKSTRLNSSHSSISYAVFCLKKKKIINSANPAETDLIDARFQDNNTEF